MPNTRENTTREMTFEEEAKFYEVEARAEFAKETGNGDSAGVNNILRRGMRIIRKAREKIANGGADKWISVTERLPGYGEFVIVLDIYNCIFIGARDERLCELNFRDAGGHYASIAAAWMPLPELPKGE